MLTYNALEAAVPLRKGARFFSGAPTAVGAACGAVTGLVAITPACGFVSNMWAYFVGFAATAVVYFTPFVLKPLGVDDRLDCFAIHGVGGMMGSLLTGLFASVRESSPVNGAFYGNAPLFGKQIACICVTVTLCVVMTSAIYWVLWGCATALGTDMRISPCGADPDRSEHGETAYTMSEHNLEAAAHVFAMQRREAARLKMEAAAAVAGVAPATLVHKSSGVAAGGARWAAAVAPSRRAVTNRPPGS